MPRLTVDARMYSRSGIGTYLRNVLPRLVEERADLRFRLLGGPDLEASPAGRSPRVEIEAVDAPIYSVREQLVLGRAARGDSSCFWSPHYNVPLLRGVPLLTTIHDIAHLAMPELVRGRHRRAYARFMLRAAGRADSTIFVSRFSADEYARVLGRRPRRARVIHQGVDASWFEVERGDPPHPRPYVVYVGNVKPHKNVEGLLRAFAILHDEVPHDLVIVGQREGFIHGSPEVEREAARLGTRVHFTGWLEEPEIKRYVASAAALVLPSFYEGFGLPPLEAMACGCPVVVSKAASLPEVCGDAALYCDPGSPASIAREVRRVLDDRALAEELTAKGRERARLFTWERCAAETGETIDEILNR
jgi:glycosyltransferase involved in cell wall biosynthesis